MQRPYTVHLDVYRGTGLHPVASRTIRVIADTALNACCRAEEIINVGVEDNEYAASCSVRPVRGPKPVPSAALPVAA